MQPKIELVKASPTKRPTIKSVAAAAGVSAATVSNAFNHPNQLSPEVCQRILAIARELGYAGANPVARNLRRMSTNTVGVVFTESLEYAMNDPACQQFLQGVASVLQNRGLALLLLPCIATDEPELVRNAAVDGLILYAPPLNSSLTQVIRDRRLPAVFVDHPHQPGYPTIRVRDRSGASTIAEHLVRLGHRRFGIITSRLGRDFREGLVDWSRVNEKFDYTASERLTGYRQALEAAKIDVHQQARIFEGEYSGVLFGRRAVAAFHAAGFRPTAILAYSDILAIGAMEALKGLGLRVPADVSVAGFDDVPEASRIEPELTTIRQNSGEKGRRAAEFLLEIFDGRTQQEQQAILKTELIVRRSTGRR
jgi:DNA-binding LacI/PurR family transcriptional regulator